MLFKIMELRLRIVIIYLWLNAGFVLLWWPLSHWLYSDYYHRLLGFAAGSYQPSMVKVIGTCGMFPVLLLVAVAKNPVKNRDMIKVLIVLSILIAATFLYLIKSGYFPSKEYFNVILSSLNALLLFLFYPWKSKFS